MKIEDLRGLKVTDAEFIDDELTLSFDNGLILRANVREYPLSMILEASLREWQPVEG